MYAPWVWSYDHTLFPANVIVLNYNFRMEQCMLPEDDRMIETCRSVLSVLMQILDH